MQTSFFGHPLCIVGRSQVLTANSNKKRSVSVCGVDGIGGMCSTRTSMLTDFTTDVQLFTPNRQTSNTLTALPPVTDPKQTRSAVLLFNLYKIKVFNQSLMWDCVSHCCLTDKQFARQWIKNKKTNGSNSWKPTSSQKRLGP